MSGQTLQKAFVPLPGQATAVYTSSGLHHYRRSDWLGSARLTSSPARTVLSTTAYAPFGEAYAQSGQSCVADPSFTGQNPDTVSGDYDFLFREYSNQGRWSSPDPAGLAAVDPSNPQSWNRYAYVSNSPLNLVDPTGLCDAYNSTYMNSEGYIVMHFDAGPCQSLQLWFTFGPSYMCAWYGMACGGTIGGGGSSGGGGGGNSSGTGPQKTCGGGQSNQTTTIVNGSYTNSTPTVALGTAIGGYLGGPPGAAIGAAIGSFFGVGVTGSWVPSTNSVYVGPTVAAGIVPGGGSGWQVTATTVPPTQNPNSIANGPSFSASWQPMTTLGATVTKSPGSGPAVVGYSTGSRVPASGSASFNICVKNCGCS